MPETWSIIVHGGAKSVRPGREVPNREGCLAAVKAGAAILEAGGSAVEATVAAIRVLEDDATFNAGYGAVLNADGEVETDAAIMDGATLDVGAVAAVQGLRNPILAARALLRDKTCLLAGQGARRFAEAHGIPLCDPQDLIPPKPVADEGAADTVGCVAMDAQGNFASATSTGGLSGKLPGRIGDSPLPGCGLYAENEVGGVSFSGVGESILRLALAARTMDALRTSFHDEAARAAIAALDRVGGDGGVILLGAGGEPAFFHNSPHFAVAVATRAYPAQAFLHHAEYSYA